MAQAGPVATMPPPDLSARHFMQNGMMPRMVFERTGHVENVICSAGRYRIYPMKDRRNKVRKCYIALRSFMCEIYKNSKEFDKGEAGRHIIDLRTVFNVCQVEDPLGLKSKIISVMTPSDTFLISIDENTSVSFDNFFLEFRDRCREARAERLSRQVLDEEYFDAAWDVEVVYKPKLRMRANDTAGHDDLATRCPHMLGRRRLCVKSASITLFKLDVEPLADASVADEAFCVQDFHDFPLSTVSKYGSQDKYVIIRNGRCSSYGPGDLWLMTESMYMATHIRMRMSELYLEEAERRRSQGIHLSLPGISDRLIKSRSHRDKVEEHETEIARLEEEHLRKEAILLEEERKREERERFLAENPEVARQEEEEAERKRLEEERASKSVLRKLFRLTKKPEKEKESPRSEGSQPPSPPKKTSLTGLMSFRLPKSLSISTTNHNVKKTAEAVKRLQDLKKKEEKEPEQEDYTMSMNTGPIRGNSRPNPIQREVKTSPTKTAAGITRIASPNADYMMMKEEEQNALAVDTYNFGDNQFLSDESCCSPRTQTSSFSTSMQSSMRQSAAPTQRDQSVEELRRYGRNDRAYSLGSRPVKKPQRHPITPPSLHQKKHNSGSGSLNTVGSIKEEDEEALEALGKKSNTDGKLNENVRKVQENLSRLEMEERKDKHTEMVDMFRNRAHSYESSQSTRKLMGWKKFFVKRPEPAPQERARISSNESTSSRFSTPRWNANSRVSMLNSDENERDDGDFVMSGPPKHESPQSRSRTSSFGKTIADMTKIQKELMEAKRRREEPPRLRNRPARLNGAESDNFLELYSRAIEEAHRRRKEAKEKPRRKSFDLTVLTSYRRRKPIIELKRTVSDSEFVIPSRKWMCLPLDDAIIRRYRYFIQRRREDNTRLRKEQELAMEKRMRRERRRQAALQQQQSQSQPVTPCNDNDYVLPAIKPKPEVMSAKRRARIPTAKKASQVSRNDSTERLKIVRGETHMRQQKANSASVPKKPGVEVKPRCRTMTGKFIRDDQQPGPSGLSKNSHAEMMPSTSAIGWKSAPSTSRDDRGPSPTSSRAKPQHRNRLRSEVERSGGRKSPSPSLHSQKSNSSANPRPSETAGLRSMARVAASNVRHGTPAKTGAERRAAQIEKQGIPVRKSAFGAGRRLSFTKPTVGFEFEKSKGVQDDYVTALPSTSTKPTATTEELKAFARRQSKIKNSPSPVQLRKVSQHSAHVSPVNLRKDTREDLRGRKKKPKTTLTLPANLNNVDYVEVQPVIKNLDSQNPFKRRRKRESSASSSYSDSSEYTN
ncbi:unnamed protein product [Bursaphelenchus xylophilus]|uniref:(pine wood nematode) hypothetical protein n=1 Tax=Bursaphelenchus xylophilus TaxID=6326 RepID=A0A1I7RWF4_BURXY|nr:unnamed protein product [Bursaphelenchus xylophilus]CAG9128315.1 unnamed protein product [Bursaphelenchus xylophilus]